MKFVAQQCSKSEVNSFNFDKVFSTFKKYADGVPLEVFSPDPYKILVSTLLSSRTRDEVTLAACKRLFKAVPTVNALASLDTSDTIRLIYPVGFYKTKAKHLKILSYKILGESRGQIPKNREDLMKLPGVGRKTANLVLNRAFGIPAIAVDTHVHRISNLLGWVHTKTPEQTEKELVKILPKKYWPEINNLLVSIGRKFRSKKKLIEFLKNEGLLASQQL